MASETVLILGSLQDEHSAYVKKVLEAEGETVEMLESNRFPEDLKLSYDPRTFQGNIRVSESKILDFEQIKSIYWRNYWRPEVKHLALDRDEEYPDLTTNDSVCMFQSFLKSPKLNWVNGWEGFFIHQHKPYALSLLAKLNVKIPKTLISNDFEQIANFISSTKKAIAKPVLGGLHTRTITVAELESFMDENHVDLPPMTVQEYVPGTNIRVFVAGSKVAACEVSTSCIDFRDDNNPVIRTVALPDEVAQESVRIARALELKWTGMDYRLTADGQYYFLEANPSPMFMGFERKCGLQITKMLTDLLRREA